MLRQAYEWKKTGFWFSFIPAARAGSPLAMKR